MTPLSNEILENYQVRKNNKQKLAFIDLLQKHFPQLVIEESRFPKCRNLVIGDPEKAKGCLTAHYDTCARAPFPTSKSQVCTSPWMANTSAHRGSVPLGQ